MNRIYRTLWSVATQSWQAVPETAKSAGKKSKSSAGGVLASVALGLSLVSGANAQAPPAVNQLPTGGSVARGTATISQTATAQAAAMTVNQASQRAVINWNTFNVGSNASVNFVQPNAQAVTLNRVNDSNPSQIFGRISANGQVFLTNANGVYFSRTSSVDVGAFTATTHSITDDNFMSGNYVFERNGATGKIINEGNITAALSGYVALLAPEVQNAGVVVARAGTVAMAAGETITLNIDGVGGLAGITTTPSAIASLVENKLAVLAPDGQIILSAVALNKLQAGLIKNSGSLEANSLVNKGGKIVLEADQIAMDRNSKIEAKGPTGGGTVLVGGDWQGSGTLRQATKVTMDAGATIDASATDNGDGGKVVLWSDVHNADSVTQVNGSINAKAGLNGGNGGKVETSGHQLKVGSFAQVDTQGGQWLLDPYNFTVAAGGDITGAQLGNALNSGNVTIQTFASGNATATGGLTTSSSAASGNGDISINDAVTWSSANVLNLKAVGAINGSGNLTMSSTAAGAGVVFEMGADGTYVGTLNGYGITAPLASFTKKGVGTLTLAPTTTSTTSLKSTISEGILKLGGSSKPLGDGRFEVTVNSGATLDLVSYLTFGNSNSKLTLNGLGVGGIGALIKTGSSNSEVTSPVVLGSDTSITNNSAVNYLKFSGGIQGNNTNLILGGSATGGSFISSRLNLGTGSLTKTGTGVVYFDSGSSNSLYSGGTYILGGTLQTSSNVTLTNPFGTGDITVNGGDFYLYRSSQNAGTVTIGANGGTINSVSYVIGSTTYFGTLAASTKFVIDNTSTATISAKLSGSGLLTKSGTGTLILAADNTYTGNTTIYAGTLQIGTGSTIGSIAPASAISVASGATLAYNLTTATHNLVPTPDVISVSNTITGTGTIANIYASSIANSNTQLDLSGSTLSSFNGTYSVYINEGLSTPAIASIKLGSSPDLSNATFNLVTAGYKSTFTSVQGITWTGTATLGGPPSTLSLKANGIGMTSGVMGLGATLTLNANDLSIGQGGAWSLTGNVNGTTGTTYLPLSNTAIYTLSGTVIADVLNGQSITQSGKLEDGGSAGSLVVNGNGGTLLLSGANTYTGNTTVNSGILKLGSASALGSGVTGAVTVASGAALDLGGQTLAAAKPLTLNGTGVSGGGALFNSGTAAAVYSGLLTLGSDTLIVGGTTATRTIALTNTGSITGAYGLTLSGVGGGSLASTLDTSSGTLTKLGTGTWTLTGNNTYAGTTTVSAGTLQVGNGGSTGTLGTGAVVDNAILFINRFGAYRLSTVASYAGAITGTGNIKIQSKGNLTIDRDITLSGAASRIDLLAGSNYTTGYTDDGDLTLNNTITTSDTGTINIFTASPSTSTGTSTSNLMLKMVGATGALKYKNYFTTALSMPSAVLGTRNFNYRQAETLSYSGATFNKTYDGATTATLTGGSISGAIDGDSFTVSATPSGTYSSANAGTTISVTATPTISAASGSGWSLSGVTTSSATYTGTIAARPITVTANAQNKVYGNADPALTYTLTSGSMVNSETLSGALSRASGETVGTYAIGQGTLAASSNYALTYAAANLVIDPRPVALTGQMNYSGQPTLDTTQTGTTLSATNVVQGDSLTITGTAPLAAAAAGTQAITAFNNLGLSNSNYTTTGASGSVNVIPTGGINVTPLNNNEVAALIGSQLAGLTGSQIAAFSTTQLQVFSWQQIAALSPSQFAALSPAQLASLSAAQLQGLSAAQMSFMTPAQLGGLTPSQFAGLNNAQLQAMSAAQVRAISTAQLSLLSPAQIALLTGNAATPLSLQQIMALTPAQLGGMSTVQVARLTAAEVSSLSDAQLHALSLEQLAAISPASLAALSSEQIMALSLTQVTSLTPEQLSSLSPTQIASLSAEEVASFNTQQLAAIGIFPAVVTPDEAPVATAKFEAPIPVMTEVATPNVPAVEVATPVVTPVTPSVSTVEAAPVAITATDANAHTGVLAITVFSGADARPITTGVAFEQDANSVSLRLTSAPSVPPVSAKLVFNDKLTTFMVAHTNGQMVEFQGGLINKRLIIVAPSSAAKQIARADMNMVLAAAITSLGAENRVVLANLDGVVIDLR